MHCKVYIWCCIVCVTICSVHLWIYSVRNGKLSSKLKILYFWPPCCSIWHKSWPFLQLTLFLKPRYASQCTLFALFHLYNHFYCPFMDLQHSKWQIALKIEDFVFLTSIFPKIWPVLKFLERLQSYYALYMIYLVLYCLCNHFSCPFVDL